MHIIINGGGMVGSHLALKMAKKGHMVVVIEEDPITATKLAKDMPSSVTLIEGDGCDSVIQLDAGADSADIFVSASGEDEVNLVACEIAKTVNGVPRCVARVNNPKNERIFRRLGIESVSSTTIISRMIEGEAVFGTMQSVSMLASNDIGIFFVDIQENKPGKNRGKKKVSDISLPEGSSIIAVKTQESIEIKDSRSVVNPGDEVIVICEASLIDDVRGKLNSLWK